MKHIWATVLLVQEDLITKYCFGDCGKALIGGIVDDVAGPLIPCKQEVCPYEEATMEAGEFKSEGEIYNVTLRKLKEGK